MTLRLNGSTSGFTQIDAAAVAGDNSITLPTLSGAITIKDSSGNTEVGTGVTFNNPSANVFAISNSGGERLRIDSSGSITAGGSIVSGANPNLGGNSGVQIVSDGIVRVAKASGNIFEAWTTGSSTRTFAINANGNFSATGSLEIGVGSVGTANAPGVSIYKNNSNAAYAPLYVSQGSTSGNLITGHNANSGENTFTVASSGTIIAAAGNVNINKVTNGANLNVRNDATQEAAIEVYKGGFTTNERKVLINNDGSAAFTGEIKIEGASTPAGRSSRISKYGSLLIATTSDAVGDARCSIDSGNGNITSVGSASFDETVTIGSGSAAPDDYGLIAYANANSLSNKSAVYARNLANGRNFTGDNASGTTTFELYANGQGNFGAASNSTGNNGVLVGGGNGTLNLYTDRYSTDCFQILNTSGSGTNIALKAYGNGKLEMSGSVLIGRTDDGQNHNVDGIRLPTNGTSYFIAYNTAAMSLGRGTDNGQVLQFRRGSGFPIVGSVSVTTSNATFNNSASDERLKKNFETWDEEVLPYFKSLNPKKFNFTNQEDSEEKSKGYVAQENVDKFPEAYPLLETDEGSEEEHKRYMFNPSGMVVYLMKALQEEISKREALEARIAALEGS